MTEDEKRLIQDRARKIYDDMMGTSPARTVGSDPAGEGAAPSSPAIMKGLYTFNCLYFYNGCAHPHFCADGCAARG